MKNRPSHRRFEKPSHGLFVLTRNEALRGLAYLEKSGRLLEYIKRNHPEYCDEHGVFVITLSQDLGLLF